MYLSLSVIIKQPHTFLMINQGKIPVIYSGNDGLKLSCFFCHQRLQLRTVFWMWCWWCISTKFV